MGAAAGGLLLAAPTASAAESGSAYVLSDVQCDANHNGVLDLTLVNERATLEAVFVVVDSRSADSSSFTVAPQSASAVTFTDLVDGTVQVPVAVDGVAEAIAVDVACDVTAVTEEVAGGAPAAPSATRSKVAAGDSLPSTGASSTWGLLIGSGLVLSGAAASLVSRRRYA